MNKFYTLYILKCVDQSLYTGIALDLESRLEAHRKGSGSKYVRAKLPFVCVYTEILPSKSEALKREIAIKKLSRKAKLDLIASSNPDIDLP